MVSVDMGFEAVLNQGLPPTAAGRAAGFAAAANGKNSLRAGQAEDAGSSCFRTALRAAAEKDKVYKADSPSTSEAPSDAAPRDSASTPDAEAFECSGPGDDAKPAEAPAETQPPEYPAFVCSEWIHRPEAASSRDNPAGGAGETGGDPSSSQTGKAVVPGNWTELADLLQRLQESLSGDAAGDAALLRQIAEGIERYPAFADGGTAPRNAGIPADVLSRLRDALSATLSNDSIPAEEDSTAQMPAAASEPEGHATAETKTADARHALDAAEILSAVRRVLNRLRAADGTQPNHPTTRAANAETAETPAGATAVPGAWAGAADATAGYPAAQRAIPHSEDARKGVAPPPSRVDGVGFERSGPAAEGRFGSSAESGDLRQSADDALYSKMATTTAPAAAETEPLPDAFAVSGRETHAAPVAEKSLEKAGDGPSAVRDKEAMAGSGAGRAGIFDQIVQRAAVQLKNDQGEINIDLKPDFLGRVRMQIVTENQQVTVRIVTELATVRDMIETGLNQLKSELQSQGLQVERLEVAVADDHRQRGWQQANGAPVWKTAATGDVPGAERTESEDRFTPLYYRPQTGGTAGIDMFV